MNKILTQLRQYGLIPIVTLNNPEDARLCAKALLKARLPVLEITFRTNGAEEAIRIISGEYPDIILGAGTILTKENARKAASAGARFLLSPGFNPGLVDFCMENEITIIPGINSPTQIESALEKGLNVLKFFPAEASGGINLIKSMAAPFPSVHFVPTGGINNENIASYFSYSRVLACGGSWIAKSNDITAGRINRITENALAARKAMLGFKIKTVELPHLLKDESKKIDPLFSGLFHQEMEIKDNSIQVAEMIKFPLDDKQNKSCTIYIETIDLDRALFHIRQQGYSIKKSKNKTGEWELHLSEKIGKYRIKIFKKNQPI